MFVSASLQNTSVRQHSNNFTTVISLSATPVWTRPAARDTSRESLACTTARPSRPAHLERTKYFPTCLQTQHRCCWESPASDGTPAPGNRSPDGRPWSAKRSPTWRRTALPGSWRQHQSPSDRRQAGEQIRDESTHSGWISHSIFYLLRGEMFGSPSWSC